VGPVGAGPRNDVALESAGVDVGSDEGEGAVRGAVGEGVREAVEEDTVMA